MPHHEWQAVLSRSMRWLPPRLRKPWLGVVVGALLVIGLAFFLGDRSATSPAPRQTAPGTMSFVVGSRPTLVFDHAIGNVHITSGPAGQLSITENRNGFIDAIHIRYQQSGDTIHITSDIDSGLISATWVDFTVSVPSQARISVGLPNGGTLEADGLDGQIALTNTNGSIWATNDRGSLSVSSESGSINITHFTGQLTATTQNGTITTSDVQASGQTTMQAESGTINFHGSLDPHGHYLFKGTNGLIGITLPPKSAIHVDAHSASGAINTGFPGIRTYQAHGSGGARGNVGDPPLAQLTIQTVSGPIMLQPGG